MSRLNYGDVVVRPRRKRVFIIFDLLFAKRVGCRNLNLIWQWQFTYIIIPELQEASMGGINDSSSGDPFTISRTH